jgi:hypothetical protein
MIELGFILHYLWVKDEQEGLLSISGGEGEGRFLFSVKGVHQIVPKQLHTYTALLQWPVSKVLYNITHYEDYSRLRLKTTMLAFSTFLTLILQALLTVEIYVKVNLFDIKSR